MLKNYDFGETTTHYAFCRHDGCLYTTDDYQSERSAREDILEHLKDEHGEDDV